MKFFSILISALTFFSHVNSQSLDEILDKHYEASRVEIKAKQKSVKMDVAIEMMGHKLTQTLYFQNPGQFRMEVESMGQGMKIVKKDQSFYLTRDDSVFSPLTPMESKEYYFQSEFEGVLYNYKEKGHILDYLGMKDFKGETYHGIAVKLYGKEELAAVLYLHAETYLLRVQLEVFGSPQHPQQKATLFDEYKEFEGMPIPTSIKTYMGSPDPITMIINQVETNIELPSEMFRVVTEN